MARFSVTLLAMLSLPGMTEPKVPIQGTPEVVYIPDNLVGIDTKWLDPDCAAVKALKPHDYVSIGFTQPQDCEDVAEFWIRAEHLNIWRTMVEEGRIGEASLTAAWRDKKFKDEPFTDPLTPIPSPLESPIDSPPRKRKMEHRFPVQSDHEERRDHKECIHFELNIPRRPHEYVAASPRSAIRINNRLFPWKTVQCVLYGRCFRDIAHLFDHATVEEARGPTKRLLDLMYVNTSKTCNTNWCNDDEHKEVLKCACDYLDAQSLNEAVKSLPVFAETATKNVYLAAFKDVWMKRFSDPLDTEPFTDVLPSTAVILQSGSNDVDVETVNPSENRAFDMGLMSVAPTPIVPRPESPLIAPSTPIPVDPPPAKIRDLLNKKMAAKARVRT